MPNERAIKYLSELKDEACVVIFTRFDADTQTPGFMDGSRKVSDEEWARIIEDFDEEFLDDAEWEQFGEIVNRNLDKNPESE